MLQLRGTQKGLTEQELVVQMFRPTVDKGHSMEPEHSCVSFDWRGSLHNWENSLPDIHLVEV